MTLEQFKASFRTYRKLELRSIGCFMVAMFAFAISMAWVVERSRERGFDALCWVVVGVCIPTFAVLAFYSAVRYPQRQMRGLGLLCPSCQKMLVGFTSQVVVATGRCDHCGAQVLESR